MIFCNPAIPTRPNQADPAPSQTKYVQLPVPSLETHSHLITVSCFDEKLAEDRRVNRLEDSYLLWRSVVSCKLLARTQIILFLNKCTFIGVDAKPLRLIDP